MRRRIEEVRKGIKIKETIDALQACVEGTRELTKEQIRAAEILLKKSMPDLKEIEHKGDVSVSLSDLVMRSMQQQAKDEASTTTH